MKKFILSLVFAMFAVVNVNAQWTTVNYEYDELLQNPVGTTHKFIDEYSNTFEFGELDKGKKFKCDITTNEGIFDFHIMSNSFGTKCVGGIVGLYDENNKLIKRWDETFIIAENVIKENKTCRPCKWKQINTYLLKNKGHITFIIYRYDMENLVMNVPCLNN